MHLNKILCRNHDKFFIRAVIKGLSLESKKVKKFLMKANSPKTAPFLMERSIYLSSKSRHYLLAYALLQNKKYKSVERNCSQYNLPKADLIHEIILSFYPLYSKESSYYEPLKIMRVKYTKCEISLDYVKSWLAGTSE